MKKILSAFLLFTCFCFHAQTTLKNVDAEEFKKMIDTKKYVLIDLRTSDEIEKKGKIAGANQLDFLDKNSEAIIQKLDKNKPYLIYCAGGGRSSECGDLMTSLGFKEVINLEKGYDDWKRKGYQTDKK